MHVFLQNPPNLMRVMQLNPPSLLQFMGGGTLTDSGVSVMAAALGTFAAMQWLAPYLIAGAASFALPVAGAVLTLHIGMLYLRRVVQKYEEIQQYSQMLQQPDLSEPEQRQTVSKIQRLYPEGVFLCRAQDGKEIPYKQEAIYL